MAKRKARKEKIYAMHELSSRDIKNHLFTPDIALTDQRKDSMQIQLGEPMGLLRIYVGAWVVHAKLSKQLT